MPGDLNDSYVLVLYLNDKQRNGGASRRQKYSHQLWAWCPLFLVSLVSWTVQ